MHTFYSGSLLGTAIAATLSHKTRARQPISMRVPLLLLLLDGFALVLISLTSNIEQHCRSWAMQKGMFFLLHQDPSEAIEHNLVVCTQIEMERRRLKELNETKNKIAARIKENRKKSGGVNAAQETNWAVHKQIKILENRLEKCNHKFNEAITKNKDLREQINNLRRERLVFDGIYKKLEKELQDKKKDMANIIDICNAAYEAREAVRTHSAS